MKKYLILIFIFTLSRKFYSQNIYSRIQKQMWYVGGDIFRGDTCSIYTEKILPCSGYLVFGPDELELHWNETENRVACHYQILSDKIMLSYKVTFKGTHPNTEEVNLLYSLKETGQNFILIPISAEDYK